MCKKTAKAGANVASTSHDGLAGLQCHREITSMCGGGGSRDVCSGDGLNPLCLPLRVLPCVGQCAS